MNRINFSDLNSFNNGFYISKNNIKLFNNIENLIIKFLNNKKQTINFTVFKNIQNWGRVSFIWECITLWDMIILVDGEDIIASSLNGKIIEKLFDN